MAARLRLPRIHKENPKMSTEKLKPIEELYSSNIKKYGAESRAAGWPTDEGHKLRFDKLAYLLHSAPPKFSLNDFGCGYGAFYTYLVENGYDVGDYYGYDISADMLEKAQQNIDASNAHFIHHSELNEEADFSVAGGTFNVKADTENQAWQAYIIESLDMMLAHSRFGYSFNLLTKYVDWQEDHLFYGDPGFFFDYCTAKHGCRVALLHDYPLYEWTIVAFKS